MRDFWRNSGYRLLRPDDEAAGPAKQSAPLPVTEAFLRAYFLRPEVRPVPESCDAERALHDSLTANPRELVSEARLAALADPDARDNYRVVLDFRDRLLRAGTIEAAYLQILSEAGGVRIPPLFLDQLTHVIARALLEGCTDGLRARAGELLFREQQVTINEGHIMAADAEVVEHFADSGGFGDLGRLLVQNQTPLRKVELDVIDSENAEIYWTRDQRHDLVLNLNFAGDGLDALCRVLEAWVAHFLDVEVGLQPVQEIRDERWAWHLGLDAEGSRLLDDLYNGVEVEEARLARLLSLFRIEFRDPAVMRPDLAGRPVYAALCMTDKGRLKLKPQNLLFNLPLARPA